MLLVILQAALAFHAPPHLLTAPTKVSLRVKSPPCLFFGAERQIALSSSDERRVISAVQTIARKANRWRADEWRVFGAPPLQYSCASLADGVRLSYFLASEAGRLTEDGALEVTVNGNVIKWSSQGKRRAKNEDVLYRMLLNEIRAGSLSDCCRLAIGLYPPSAGVGNLVAKIDAACLVDRKGQYKRF